MAHNHAHDRSRLKFTLALTGGYCVVEFVGGLLTNSLALLSDAGHMLSDVSAMGHGAAANNNQRAYMWALTYAYLWKMLRTETNPG